MVVRVNTVTKDPLKISVGDDPQFLVFVAQTMWVANGGSTITPIPPGNDPLDPIPLPARPTGMIISGGNPLVATTDGSVLEVDPTSHVASRIAQVSQNETHLIPTDDHVWAWQEGNEVAFRFDSTGGSLEEHSLPFVVDRMTEFRGFLWAVAEDGRIAKLDADDAQPVQQWEAIEDQPWQFVRDEPVGRLLLLAEDGTVYELPT